MIASRQQRTKTANKPHQLNSKEEQASGRYDGPHYCVTFVQPREKVSVIEEGKKKSQI
jgi:hypothetical protein